MLNEILTLAMDDDRGPVIVERREALDLDIEDDRAQQIVRSIVDSAAVGIDPVAWAAETSESGCPDLFVPGTVVTCADSGARSGPAWVATRPLTLVGEGSDARILVASGIGWSEDRGLPTTPSPWADSGDDGRWRWGPSTPFTLAELRAADATYFQQFPIPSASLERTTTPEATIDVPGFTGTRIFVRATAGTADSPPSDEVPLDLALSNPATPYRQRSVYRIAVPPGLDAGRDGASVRIGLGDVPTIDRTVADRWLVTVVPINDWGEVGQPVRVRSHETRSGRRWPWRPHSRRRSGRCRPAWRASASPASRSWWMAWGRSNSIGAATSPSTRRLRHGRRP